MAVSCVKEDGFVAPKQDAEGVRIEFVGESTDDATKVSIGEKDGNKYPLLWQEGDVISVWSKNVTTADLPKVDADGNTVPGNANKILGEQAELYPESAGYQKGTFMTVNTINVKASTDVVITYPGTAKFADNKVSATIPTVQTQRGSNSSMHVGNYALAYATSTLSTASKDAVSFNLSQKTAFVKLVLSTSEYSSMNLSGAKLYSPGAKLAGKAVYDINAGTMTLSSTSDNVGAKLRSAVSFSGTQTLYFTAAPCDLTGKECYVVITMTDDTKTVTIPAKINGGKLEAGKLSVITVSNISSSTNECSWYEPVETRYIAAYGEAWSYGPQNCYVAYFGQDGAFGEAVTFDVKARGNFTKCKKPAKVVVLNACEQNISNKNNLEINGTVCHDGTNYVSYNLDNTYTISVKAKMAGTYNGYSSKVLVLDSNNNTLWSINVWGNQEQLKDIKLANNSVILDRNIGSTIYMKTDGSVLTSEHYVMGSYYQWGRPFQSGWSSSGGLFDKKDAGAQVVDFAVSAANPLYFFYKADGNQNWYTAEDAGSLNDLWGNDNQSGLDSTPDQGTKSVFDPCPKGYMVASPSVLDELMSKSVMFHNDVKLDGSGKATRPSNATTSGFNWLVYTNGSTKAYIPFAGCKWGNSAGNCDNNKVDVAALWSNSNAAGNQRSYLLNYRFKNAAFGNNGKNDSNRAVGYPVRCMKDTENR